MNVLLFGGTGMVGQGVLRECVLAPDIHVVQTVGRTATGVQHAKLREIEHPDLWDYSLIEDRLSGYDACFFCLGVSSTGMPESEYKRVTYGITIAAAQTLSMLNPDMTFIYVSGAGADSSERGPRMWARIRGMTENALLRMPFKAVYIFRPAAIQALHGAQSRTAVYRILYSIMSPLIPLIRRLAPGYISTTEQIGQAMLKVARHGAPKQILESRDIVNIALAR